MSFTTTDTESHQGNDYLIIQNYEEASSLYSDAVDEQWKRELVVQAAMSKLQQAMLDLQKAQARLTEADYRVGRARFILRKSGFDDVFREQSLSRHSLIYSHHQYRVATIPELALSFAVRLD
ncbi:hypothetical protein EDB85DRAFT_2160979 [Lactarius pseudohatsudake]|nr:hypothetical protein EDB85DRAFT_2160979 [Lactarius pseudohatsudake]